VKVSGVSVSADVKEAKEFLEILDKLIVEKKLLATANV
jgi:ribosome-binding factor A